MRVVVLNEALADAMTSQTNSQSSAWGQGLLHGRVLDDGEVVQVLQATDSALPRRMNRVLSAAYGISDSVVVGVWKHADYDNPTEFRNLLSAAFQEADSRHILLLKISASANGHEIQAFEYETEDSEPTPIECNVYSLEFDVFSRIRDLVNIEALSKVTVAVIGLGSGGARVALELARSGVGRLLLVDPDRLEPNNIARHPCGARDIGRYKTKAVRDLIHEHNPYAQIVTSEIDVLEHRDEFQMLVGKSDLVVACTGSPAVNNLTNEYCLKLNKPAVYGGAWEKAMAGFAMRVIPNETPCFACVHEILQQNAPPLDPSRVVDYSVVTDPRELRAEPGLSVDIGFITLIQAKLALLVLLKESGSTLEDIPQNYILWFNKSYDRFRPFNCLKLHTKRRSDCAVCNYDGWLRKKSEETGLDVTQLRNMEHSER